MLFKNPVRTSKRTPHFTITKINWLTLFKFKITTFRRMNPHLSASCILLDQVDRAIPDLWTSVSVFSIENNDDNSKLWKKAVERHTSRLHGVRIKNTRNHFLPFHITMVIYFTIPQTSSNIWSLCRSWAVFMELGSECLIRGSQNIVACDPPPFKMFNKRSRSLHPKKFK
jgi:hypothetical protein